MRNTSWRARLRNVLTIGRAPMRGATRALNVTAVLLLIAIAVAFALPDVSVERSLGVAAALAIVIVAALAAWLLVALLRLGTLAFWWGQLLIAAALCITLIPSGFAAPGVALLLAWVVLAVILLGAGVAEWRAQARVQGSRWPAVLAAAVGTAGIVTLVIGLALPGFRERGPHAAPANIALPTLPDPGRAGAYSVRELTYGSGRDRHRREFAEGVAIATPAVDGSKLIDGWSGAAGWARTRYWGFDASALPLQGRVWYPAGDGPFPIVLIVHGNHDMEDFSDTGYAYLGKHFASRGFIAVSVDENFLNSSSADLLGGIEGGLDTENDARGWLLLEHLRLFRSWNDAHENPFYRRVDLSRVVLIGHSRGGEAVAEAALFNRLSHAPDDARVRFAYGFGIRGVIAIAPVDGQYDPRARGTPVIDTSYLVIHGSHDGDVQSFMGSRQYARALFRSCRDCFKASVYVVGANHGQFNTRWGRADNSWPFRLLLNLAPIMDPESQRAIAKSLFSAFLETTLHDRRGYEAVFAAAPRRAPWLRDAVELVTDYRSGASTAIADFEEDADVTSGSTPEVAIDGAALTRWAELEPELKWKQRESATALLGWDRRTKDAAPEYRLRFAHPPGRVTEVAFSLAMADDDPRRDETATWTAPATLDASVVLTDRAGRSASVPLSTIAPLRAPVDATTRKLELLDDTALHEPVFQRFSFPIARFAGIDATALADIALRFDRSPAGAIYVDDVDLRIDANTHTIGPGDATAIRHNADQHTRR